LQKISYTKPELSWPPSADCSAGTGLELSAVPAPRA
jgi:hypothetical protein